MKLEPTKSNDTSKDSCLLIESGKEELDSLVKLLSEKYDSKDMGETSLIISIKLDRTGK
jgi:hypothetical protein